MPGSLRSVSRRDVIRSTIDTGHARTRMAYVIGQHRLTNLFDVTLAAACRSDNDSRCSVIGSRVRASLEPSVHGGSCSREASRRLVLSFGRYARGCWSRSRLRIWIRSGLRQQWRTPRIQNLVEFQAYDPGIVVHSHVDHTTQYLFDLYPELLVIWNVSNASSPWNSGSDEMTQIPSRLMSNAFAVTSA